jgi:hypothetical protein
MKSAKGVFDTFSRFWLAKAGLICFVVLLVTAACFYSGGTPIAPKQVGYRWSQNFICDLLHPVGFDGMPNKSRPYAALAMILFCGLIFTILSHLANLVPRRTLVGTALKVSAIGACLSGLGMFTAWHDAFAPSLFFFAIQATIFTLLALRGAKSTLLFVVGLIISLLIVLNYFIFLSRWFITGLAFLQKLTLSAILIWLYQINEIKRSSIQSETTEI